MKRTLVILLLFATVLSLASCEIESAYSNSDILKENFEENRDLFLEVALEALGYGESTFISTYEYFRPEGASADASGLYVYNTETEECRGLDSRSILRLFSECSVHSLGVKTEEDVRVCEFSIEGGRQYFNGIYYADPDSAFFLNDLSIPLVEDGNGYSYSVENMNFYTEKWDDHFYYYVAKTL